MENKFQISFFAANQLNKEVGLELANRGHSVVFNEINRNLDFIFAMGMPTSLEFIFKLGCKISSFNKEKTKIIANVFDIPPWRLNIPNYKNTYLKYKEFLEQKCNYITTLSETTCWQLKSLWNINSIPLFLEFNDKLIDTLPEIGNHNDIVMVSRLEPHKKFEIALFAISLLKERHNVTIVGDGSLRQYLTEIAKSLQLNVMFKGVLNEFETVLEIKKAKIVIQPSTFEGKSIVPKEAIYLNKPCIMTNIPINREFHPKGGIYFEPDDIIDLKNKIEEVYLNPPSVEFLEIAKSEIEKCRIKNVATEVELFLNKIK